MEKINDARLVVKGSAYFINCKHELKPETHDYFGLDLVRLVICQAQYLLYYTHFRGPDSDWCTD